MGKGSKIKDQPQKKPLKKAAQSNVFSDQIVANACILLKLKGADQDHFSAELNNAKQIFDYPSPTKRKTNASEMRKLAKRQQGNVDSMINFLSFFKTGAGAVPELDEQMQNLNWSLHTNSSTNNNLSPGLIWGAFTFPFENDLNQAISGLEKISGHLKRFHQNKSLKPKDEISAGKESSERLLLEFCRIYSKYTGKTAMAWYTGSSAMNAKKICGPLVDLLLIILPDTNYNYKITKGALQKRLERMNKLKKYKNIWPDSKRKK